MPANGASLALQAVKEIFLMHSASADFYGPEPSQRCCNAQALLNGNGATARADARKQSREALFCCAD